jgi:hypothetical protein
MERRQDDIVAFAEIDEFLDTPLKRFSSGMYVRLAFAVAAHLEPEILLVDEVLAVGDESFPRKCLAKLAEFRRRGRTILFVTHTLGLVERMCDDALWLRHGRPAGRGDPKRVIDEYLTYVAEGEEARLRASHAAALGAGAGPGGDAAAAADAADGVTGGYRPGRWGSREVEIRDVRFADARGRARHVFVPGETVALTLRVHAARPVEDFVFGIGLFSAEGTNVYGTNTDIEGFVPHRVEGDAEVTLVLEGLSLVEGTYTVDVAAHRRDGTPYDYHRSLYSLRIKSRTKDVGLYRPAHRWTFGVGVDIDAPPPREELELGEEGPA